MGHAALPTPPGHWLFGHQPQYARNPLEAFRSWSAEYGDAMRLRFGPLRVLLLTSPQAVEDLSLHRAADFRKAPVIRRLAAPLIGDSLFTVEGGEWRRQRELLEPYFVAGRMDQAGSLAAEGAARMAESWKPGEVVDLLSETMRMSQQVVARALFGSSFSDEEVDRVSAALALSAADFQQRVNSPSLALPEWVPVPRSRMLRRAAEELKALVRTMVRSRSAASDGDDLLGQLLDRRQTTPWLTDELIRDNVLMLLVQGREDPALLLTWAFYLLDRHPHIAEQLRAEVSEAFDGQSPAGADHLQRLRLAPAVLREALRLYPPVYGTGRQALRDTTVAGVRVRRGTIVLTSQAVTHRDPRWFEEPDAFRPERWTDGLAERLPMGAYAPFGLGPRRCLGEHLAWTIAIVGLVVVSQRCRLVRDDTEPVEPTVVLSLRPSRPVLMRAEPLQGAGRGVAGE